jgi:hypothetical protein
LRSKHAAQVRERIFASIFNEQISRQWLWALLCLLLPSVQHSILRAKEEGA